MSNSPFGGMKRPNLSAISSPAPSAELEASVLGNTKPPAPEPPQVESKDRPRRPEQEPSGPYTFHLSKTLHSRMKKWAEGKGVSMKELVAMAVEDYMNRNRLSPEEKARLLALDDL